MDFLLHLLCIILSVLPYIKWFGKFLMEKLARINNTLLDKSVTHFPFVVVKYGQIAKFY